MKFSAFERYRQLVALPLTSVTAEEQGSDYEAGRIVIGAETWRIRTARITPTKPGAFVAVWHRAADGTTQPYNESDDCDGLMVFVEDGDRFGVFKFAKKHLVELGVIQSDKAPGKRGFRVYPDWCTGLNKQATRTQQAQASAFSALA